MWWAAAAAGLQVAGGVASFFGRQAQAKRMRAETEEQVRRMRLEQASRLGQATAEAGATGFEFDSASLQKYLTDMSVEFRRQSDWALKAGRTQANDVSNASLFGLATDFGGAMFQYGAANNWWKTPAASAPADPTYTPGFGMPLWKG